MLLPLYPMVPEAIDRRVRALDPALPDAELSAAALKFAGIYEAIAVSRRWVETLRLELIG